jgi:hypothetical protein
MTKREIINTLLAKQLPERVGLNESFWPFIGENAWQAQGIAPDTDFIRRFNLDLRSIAWFSAPAPRPDLARVVAESDAWVVNRDGWGADTKTWKHKAGTLEHVGFTVSSPEIWTREFREAFAAIDVRDHVDLAAMKARYAEAMAGEEFVTYSALFVFEDLRRILGDASCSSRSGYMISAPW